MGECPSAQHLLLLCNHSEAICDMEHLIQSSLNAYFASCIIEKTNNVFCWVLQAYESGQYLLHECCHPDSLQLAQLCFGNGASL
jgi:hypothetical protein